jgi:cytochrome c oxidase subunit 2
MTTALIDTRSQYDGLARTYVIIACVVFALVVLTMGFMLVRFRAGRDPERTPGRKHESKPLEIGYVVLLVAITAVLLTITFRHEDRIDGLNDVAQGSPSSLRVDVVGAQWNWRFTYPGRPAVHMLPPSPRQPTRLYVPVGGRVAFSGHSQDVLHDFWIPDLKFQRQVWPDHTERWALTFPRAGWFAGVCAWFCGLYHQNMHFVVHAVPGAEFDRWLARRRAEARS